MLPGPGNSANLLDHRAYSRFPAFSDAAMNSATTFWEMATSSTNTPSSWEASQSVSTDSSARVQTLAPSARTAT